MHYLLAMSAPAEGEGGGSILGALLPFILMLLVIYFLLLRPQMKKQKEHQAMIGSLQKGDKVITSSGMFGTILKISDDQNKVLLKVSEDVQLEFLKSSIAQKVT
jgi:preprotein translocase subunit YajC